MAYVQVRLAGRDRLCLGARCNNRAQLTVQRDHHVLPYCLDDAEDRLTFYQQQGRAITYTTGARKLVLAEGRELIA